MAVIAKCEACGKEIKLTAYTVKTLLSSVPLTGDNMALAINNLSCIIPETQDVFMRNSGDSVEMICSEECMNKYIKERRIARKESNN